MLSGLEKAFLAIQGLSALNTFAGGLAGVGAATSEAERLNAQADLAMVEARRNAEIQAVNVRSFRETQASAYLNSGVTLEGTPMEVLASTVRKGQAEVDAIMARGSAQAQLLRQQAGQTRRAGWFGAISASTNALSTVAKTYAQGRATGIFGNAPSALTLRPYAGSALSDPTTGTP